ncbi:hypothetical protein ABFX02_05G009200 [Erythranthe guttata]
MSQELIPTPTSTKSADDTEIDTPPHAFQPIKPLPFTYGGAPQNHHHHRQPPPPPAMVAAAYKECMKNHAASLGGHSVDGCGEFITSPSATAAAGDPTSLKCAACGCHRNFHRREPDSASITPPFLDFRHPTFPKRFSDLSSSPPPPAAAPYEQAHMLFGLSSMAVGAEEHHQAPVTPTAEFYPAGSRKRFRSKFSQEQKEKMRSFSAEMGWKMQKSDEAAVREFCREIGVTRGVLKVWMHNNKNTFAKKEINAGAGAGDVSAARNGGVLISFENNASCETVGKSEGRSTDINGSSSPST